MKGWIFVFLIVSVSQQNELFLTLIARLIDEIPRGKVIFVEVGV